MRGDVLGERTGERNGLATALAVTMAEQDALVAEADAETAHDLLGEPVEERGPGRPKGSLNKATQQEIATIKASGQSPLAFLASTMRDADKPLQRRIDCAKAMLPYVHKKQPVAIEARTSTLRVAIILPGEDEAGADFLGIDLEADELEEIQ